MIKFFIKSIKRALAIIGGLFIFIPESLFENFEIISQELLDKSKIFSFLDVQDVNIIISRFLFFLLIFIITSIIYVCILRFRQCITIKGVNYIIRIEYGNIFKKKKCKKVISFDECFTTTVGDSTGDINPTSICGQYLLAHPDLDIEQLIKEANIIPARGKSKYQQKIRYNPGTIVPNKNDLLMAFARLDERGKGRFFSRDEYLECLNLLWKELENNYSENDVCVPILGAGTTCFEGGSGASFTQQDLLNMMIWSYKLSSHKIKAPHKLRIVCSRNSDFSINNIDM